ncbi:MAG: hypothetical protein AAB403_16530 [Planctomycetota bacterium]
MPFGLEPTDQLYPRTPQPPMSLRTPTTMPQRWESAILEPPLEAPHRPHGIAKCPRYFILIGPSLIDKADHCVGLGHAIAHRVLPQYDARSDHQPARITGPHQTSITDDTCILRHCRRSKEYALGFGGSHSRKYSG